MNTNLSPLKPDSATPLGAAISIAQMVARDAWWADDCCNWIGAKESAPTSLISHKIESCNLSLYDGVAGIALFLGCVARLAHDEILNWVLRGSLNTLRRATAENGDYTHGAHNGSAGIAWVLLTLGELNGDGGLIELALKILLRMPADLDKDTRLSIADGAAGTALVSYLIGTKYGHPALIDRSFVLARRIQEAILSARHGCLGPARPEFRSYGYSHGLGGIQLCTTLLLNAEGLSRSSGLLEPDATLSQALQSDEELVYHMPTRHAGTNGWCNGTIGDLFALQQELVLTPETSPEVQRKLFVGLQALSGQNVSLDHFNLCHGVLGVAEIITACSRVVPSEAVVNVSSTLCSSIIQNMVYFGSPWLRDGERAEMPYGLMNGIVGAGYFLLRQHSAIDSPFVLALGVSGPPKAVGIPGLAGTTAAEGVSRA